MMNNYKLSRTWAEIHVDRLRNNIKNIKDFIGDKTKLMAVIKADAYGHGFYEVARIAGFCGADYLAVACIEEAKQIRKRGIDIPILILGATPLKSVEDLFNYNIIPTVFEKNLPEAISDYAVKNGKKLKIHVKVDTGMGRLGFCCYGKEENEIEEIVKISKLPGIEIEGIFTHFACADEEDGEALTKMQYDNFMYAVETLLKKGIDIPIKHCANSAAICMYKKMHLDMVRAGIILYGEYPSKFVRENTSLEVQPIMELKTTVSQVKIMKKGKGISYGQHYKTKNENEKIAVLCIGYADKYARILSGKSRVIINGHYAEQVGNICMDQMMIDVTGIPDIKYGNEVTLVGEENGLKITFSDIAELMNTISYEAMCDLGNRVVRVYFDNKKQVDAVNYLEKI